MVGGGAIPGHVHLALAAGLLGAGGAPGAGDDVVGGRVVPAEQVHRHHRELQARAPLQEDHLVGLADAEQGFEPRQGLFQDAVERGAAVTDFQHRHADPRQREHFVAGLLEHLDWQDGRAGGEVEHAIRHGGHPKNLGIPGAE